MPRLTEEEYALGWDAGKPDHRPEWARLDELSKAVFREGMEAKIAQDQEGPIPEKVQDVPREWDAARLLQTEKAIVLLQVTHKALARWAKEPRRFHVVGCGERPGVLRYMQTLEFTYYTPGTIRNKALEIHRIRWEGMIYTMASIPKAGERLARRTADRTDMRLVDGVPAVLESGGVIRHFPLQGKNIYTLENGGHKPAWSYTLADEMAEIAEAGRAADALIAARGAN